MVRIRLRLKRKGLRSYAFWEQRELIELYLKRHPEGLLIREIAEEFGCCRLTALRRIKELLKQKRIKERRIQRNVCLYYKKYKDLK